MIVLPQVFSAIEAKALHRCAAPRIGQFVATPLPRFGGAKWIVRIYMVQRGCGDNDESSGKGRAQGLTSGRHGTVLSFRRSLRYATPKILVAQRTVDRVEVGVVVSSPAGAEGERLYRKSRPARYARGEGKSKRIARPSKLWVVLRCEVMCVRRRSLRMGGPRRREKARSQDLVDTPFRPR